VEEQQPEHKLSKFIMHFERVLNIGFLMVSYCLPCHGETNDFASSSIRFSLPPARLRNELRPKPAEPEQAASTQSTPSASVGSTALESILSNGDLHSHFVRSDRFYLTQAKELSENGLVGFVGGIFTPKVIQIGKASVSSPFLTVICRKNPLCLLSGFGSDQGLTLTFKVLEVWW
jgi:hypothetical protein